MEPEYATMRDVIEDCIIDLMREHGPDGHTDGSDIIARWVEDIMDGDSPYEALRRYLPRSN
jgi:hypothetical protein